MKSLPRNGLPMCAALVAVAALGQQSADAGQASWPDGASVWHLSDLTEATGKHHPLRLEGDGVQVGVPLAGAERDASLARGGDGRIATLDGMSLLSLPQQSGSVPFPSAETMSVCVRLRATKPGGLIHTNLFSLVLHEGGLAVGILGVADRGGKCTARSPSRRSA